MINVNCLGREAKRTVEVNEVVTVREALRLQLRHVGAQKRSPKHENCVCKDNQSRPVQEFVISKTEGAVVRILPSHAKHDNGHHRCNGIRRRVVSLQVCASVRLMRWW